MSYTQFEGSAIYNLYSMLNAQCFFAVRYIFLGLAISISRIENWKLIIFTLPDSKILKPYFLFFTLHRKYAPFYLTLFPYLISHYANQTSDLTNQTSKRTKYFWAFFCSCIKRFCASFPDDKKFSHFQPDVALPLIVQPI